MTSALLSKRIGTTSIPIPVSDNRLAAVSAVPKVWIPSVSTTIRLAESSRKLAAASFNAPSRFVASGFPKLLSGRDKGGKFSSSGGTSIDASRPKRIKPARSNRFSRRCFFTLSIANRSIS